MKISDLQQGEYGDYYHGYIQLAGEQELLTALEKSGSKMIEFFNSIPESKMEIAYARGKWTIKELIVHLIDAERVFTYRAMRFARQDSTDLPGFDQDEYVAVSKANERSKKSLIEDYKAVREATINLYRSFDDDMLRYIGTANNNPASARAIGFIIVGHERHHAQIISERYL
ncbi:MAG: DinB family protein [Flavobacteriaceae bacterium]|nr:DinB family protein [Bacteroidia bacterium]NNF75323.1 DinB family protein [Flavobacteriaceae bacterium]